MKSSMIVCRFCCSVGLRTAEPRNRRMHMVKPALICYSLGCRSAVCTFQLLEQVAENRVALDPVDLANQVPARIVAPSALAGKNRAVNQRTRRPIGLQQPGDR